MDLDLRETHILGRRTYQRLVLTTACPGLAESGVSECGLSLCDQDFTVLQNRPTGAVLMLVLEGSGAVLVEGGWQPVQGGHAYFAPAGLRRGWRAAQPDWHIGWLTWAEGRTPVGMSTIPTLSQANGEALTEVMRLLWRETVAGSDPLALAHLLPLLRLHLGRLLGAEPNRRLERLWQEVDADLACAWTVGFLAERIGVGQEQLRRLCLSAHGQRPMERVRSLRLARASALLASTSMPVAAVAEAVGYADPEAFATAFRRVHGRSPRRG